MKNEYYIWGRGKENLKNFRVRKEYGNFEGVYYFFLIKWDVW